MEVERVNSVINRFRELEISSDEEIYKVFIDALFEIKKFCISESSNFEILCENLEVILYFFEKINIETFECQKEFVYFLESMFEKAYFHGYHVRYILILFNKLFIYYPKFFDIYYKKGFLSLLIDYLSNTSSLEVRVEVVEIFTTIISMSKYYHNLLLKAIETKKFNYMQAVRDSISLDSSLTDRLIIFILRITYHQISDTEIERILELSYFLFDNGLEKYYDVLYESLYRLIKMSCRRNSDDILKILRKIDDKCGYSEQTLKYTFFIYSDLAGKLGKKINLPDYFMDLLVNSFKSCNTDVSMSAYYCYYHFIMHLPHLFEMINKLDIVTNMINLFGDSAEKSKIIISHTITYLLSSLSDEDLITYFSNNMYPLINIFCLTFERESLEESDSIRIKDMFILLLRRILSLSQELGNFETVREIFIAENGPEAIEKFIENNQKLTMFTDQFRLSLETLVKDFTF